MRVCQKVFKAIFIGISVVLLLGMLLPISTSVVGEDVTNSYIYDVVLAMTFLPYLLVALVFGTLISFSEFKNKNIMSLGLLLFFDFFMLFICLMLLKEINAAADLIPVDSNDYIAKGIGFFVLLGFSIVQAVCCIAYGVFGLLRNFFEHTTTGVIGEKELERRLERMQQLKTLDILTEEEYEKKRAEFVNSIKF